MAAATADVPSLDLAPAAADDAKAAKKAKKAAKAAKAEEPDVDKKAKKAAKAAKRALETVPEEEPPAKKSKQEKAEKKAKKEEKKAKKEEKKAKKGQEDEEDEGVDGGTDEGSTATMTAAEYRAAVGITSNSVLPEPIQNFEDSPFEPRLKATLTSAGYTTPSPIQAQAWPVAMGGHDVIAIAKTGSGKTVGFLFPAFQAILPQLPIGHGQGPLALVMAPVRELAQQIQVEAEKFGGSVGIKSVCVYGGAPKGPQIGALARGRPAMVVGTPGRLNDLLALANPPVFNLKSCSSLVLDEADRMLDMGFEPQVISMHACMHETRPTACSTWASSHR